MPSTLCIGKIQEFIALSRIYETENQGDYIFSIERGTRKIRRLHGKGYSYYVKGTKIEPVELTKSRNEKIKANLELLTEAGNLLRMNGEYGAIIASKEQIYVNGMNIRALLDDFGSVILTKVIG